MEDILQELMFDIFRLFLIIVLVAVGVYFSYQTPLNDITKAYTEKACVQGGLKLSDITDMKKAFGQAGFDPAQIEINVTPAQALNISDTSYVERGGIISLEVIYNKQTQLNKIFKYLNTSASDTKNTCKRYGMSEKY